MPKKRRSPKNGGNPVTPMLPMSDDDECPFGGPEEDDTAPAARPQPASTYRCPVKLTEAEVAARGERLAKLTEELAAHRNAKREEASIWTGKIKDVEKSIAELAQIVTSGQELRDVPVREEVDGPNRAVRIIRTDTGEAIFTRAATDADLQIPIFPPDAAVTHSEGP